MNYNFATHANRLKACYSFFIKDIKYALTYLSACNGEVDDIIRRGDGGIKYRKMEGGNRKYEEELDDDNDENVEKVILLNWESLMCKAP